MLPERSQPSRLSRSSLEPVLLIHVLKEKAAEETRQLFLIYFVVSFKIEMKMRRRW
jgi:hypothetical protein